MDFTLEPPDAQWAQETVNKAMDELRQTTPNGRASAETVSVILEREKNWVRWKNELCSPFDKEPWCQQSEDEKCIGLEEATSDARKHFRQDLKDWPWKLGSEALTDIWQMGYRDLTDLENAFQLSQPNVFPTTSPDLCWVSPGEVKDYAKRVQQEDARIEMRKKTTSRLAQVQARVGRNASPVQLPATTPSETASLNVLKPDQPVARPTTPSRIAPSISNSLLHPSLPPKPGSPVPQKSPMLSSLPVHTGPIVAPTPKLANSPAPLSTLKSTAVAVPVDEQLAKFEEVQHLSVICLRLFVLTCVSRTSNGGPGLLSAQPVTIIFNILERLELVMCSFWLKKLRERLWSGRKQRLIRERALNR